MFPYDRSKDKWSLVILDRIKHSNVSRPALPEVVRQNVPDIGSDSGDDEFSRLARQLRQTHVQPASHLPQGEADEASRPPPNRAVASTTNSAPASWTYDRPGL